MPRYDWFRMFSEARTDKKLECLTDAQHRVWFDLLCLAAEQANDRGTVPAMAERLLAIEVARRDVELLRETIASLVDLAILQHEADGGLTFIHFQQRQYDKPSDAPPETARRKQAQRDRAKRDQASRDVTPMSRDVTPVTHREEDNREEDIRRESEVERRPSRASVRESSSPPPTAIVAVGPTTETPHSLVLALCEEFGADPSALAPAEKARQMSHGQWLLEQGYGEDKVRRCLAWLRSQTWRTSAIDLGTVRADIGKWDLNGQPKTAEPAATPGRANGKPRDNPGVMGRVARLQRKLNGELTSPSRTQREQEADRDIIDVRPAPGPIAGRLAQPGSH